ncbi:PAS domain S-box protein [Piscinibacter aquaticus]|uniref:histidine kinase n=1 Tax=Piscinibacter aquaticus TaxID=392597 RepID=A0A5C6TZ20_9BURK|nr:PAS domain S-box protein [Piscinibacter aquaticus]
MLMTAMDAVHAGLMISGPDGRVLAANAAWQRQVGRYARGADDTWESLLRAMVAQGVYPDAVGREDEFVRWRLSLASPDATPHELRYADQVVLVCDQRLPDGSTVHLSIDVSERQRAEQQQKSTEARLTAVLRAVPDLWFVVGPDDSYLMCSDEQHPLLIEPFERQRGQRFGDVLTPPFDRQAREALALARSTGDMQRLEYEGTMPDGRKRVFEARLAPMGDGNVLYLTRDLTELRRMERELVTLQRAVEADAAMPIVVTDSTQPDRPIVYVNAAFERLTGYARDEAVGRNCRFLNDPTREQPGLPELRAALAEGRPCTVVLANRRRDGSEFLNELSVVPIRDARGHVVQHLGVLHDVTERVRAAERLRISEELYRSVAATISDGLIVAGPDGRILACNPSAADTLASSTAALTGHRLSELGYRLHDAQDRPLMPANHPVYRVLGGGDAVHEMPLVVHRPDGAVLHVLLTARALSPGGGSKALSCPVSFRDVTEQQAAAQAVLDKQAAELASRAKSEFLSRMSHEMRTPLNAVIGFTQLLRMQPEGAPSKVAEYADHILRASEHLLGLVNEVLDLQRVEEGRAALEPRAIELAPFLDSTLDLLRPAAEGAGIALASHGAARPLGARRRTLPAPGADEHGVQRGEIQPAGRLGAGVAARCPRRPLRHRDRGHRLGPHRRAAGAALPALRAPRPRDHRHRRQRPRPRDHAQPDRTDGRLGEPVQRPRRGHPRPHRTARRRFARHRAGAARSARHGRAGAATAGRTAAARAVRGRQPHQRPALRGGDAPARRHRAADCRERQGGAAVGGRLDAAGAGARCQSARHERPRPAGPAAHRCRAGRAAGLHVLGRRDAGRPGTRPHQRLRRLLDQADRDGQGECRARRAAHDDPRLSPAAPARR